MTAKTRATPKRTTARAAPASEGRVWTILTLDGPALPDPETLTSRKDAEKVVRAIARTCRGPLLETARAEVNAFLEAGKLVEARTHDSASRAWCGQDYNDLICSSPFDGAEYETVCPRCGIVGSYRAPLFPKLKVR